MNLARHNSRGGNTTANLNRSYIASIPTGRIWNGRIIEGTGATTLIIR